MTQFTRIGHIIGPILANIPIADLCGLEYSPDPSSAETQARIDCHNEARRQMFLATQRFGAVKAWQDKNGKICHNSRDF